MELSGGRGDKKTWRWFSCAECHHRMRNTSWRCGRCGTMKGPMPLAVALMWKVTSALAATILVLVSLGLVYALLHSH